MVDAQTVGDVNPFCRCLYFSANALARVMTQQAEQAFSTVGLAPSHAFLMMSVNRMPGIHPNELATQMMLKPSTITRLLEKLEQKGLVDRTTSGKSVEVFPTRDGKGLQGGIETAWQDLYKRYTAMLGERQAKDLTDSIFEAVVKMQE